MNKNSLSVVLVFLVLISVVVSSDLDAVKYANIITKTGDPLYNNFTMVASNYQNYTKF